MDNHCEHLIRLEMDMADFSGKTVKRIDIQNIVSRSGNHKAGMALVMSFTDGATGTILVKSGEVPIIAAPYARPRMADYRIEEEADAIKVT